MTKHTTLLVIVLVSALVSFGCKEWLVGAPCVPETDLGTYQTTLTGDVTYSVETRSVQCETAVCITSTTTDQANPPETDNPELTTYQQYNGYQQKFSFCSCRCATDDGQVYDRNDDKLDDLCPCPGSSICERVLPMTVGVAENVAGSYCIPECILGGCLSAGESDETCTPSNDDEKPWAWSCQS